MSAKLIQLGRPDGCQMMGYVIKDDDGKIAVIDGGTRDDAAHLLDVLKKYGGDHPHIDAWFLTHAHHDHIGAFLELNEKMSGSFSTDGFYYNFPSVQFCRRLEPHEAHTAEEFYALLPAVARNAHIVSPRDEFLFGGMSIDVLFCDTTVVSRFGINETSAVYRLKTGCSTVLFLGDLGEEGGRRLLHSCRTGLRSDICQMAHHGQNGVGREVYEEIAPRVCLWPTPEWLWNNDAGLGYNTHTWKTVEVRGWMDGLGVSRNIVAKDGDICITI